MCETGDSGRNVNLELDFGRFMEGLWQAAPRIEEHYFEIATAGSGGTVMRERVYCYELYHQLRVALGHAFPYKLDGELDKAGHLEVDGEKKPDFVVHVPGTMEKNLVVIEVKRIERIGTDGARRDMAKLEAFVEKANYYRAIMLFYGASLEPREVRSEATRLGGEAFADRLLVMWHAKHGDEPQCVERTRSL